MALALMLVLSACGATIDTTMTVSEAGAGSRVMLLTLSDSDAEKLEGGFDAVDSSIRKHLPEAVDYSGLKPSSSGKSGTFTINFTSPEDYKKKVAALLAAGSVDEGEVEFSVSDSALKKGISIEETFESADLLEWMFKGLLADGVVSQDNKSDMHDNGTTVMVFGGEEETQYGSFNYQKVINKGFDVVTMKTQIQDENNATRTIQYEAYSDNLAVNQDALGKFIDESTPEGAKVETPSSGIWTITFTGNPAAISSATTKALGGKPAQFELAFADAPENPSEKILRVTNTATCDNVCADTGQIIDSISIAPGYTPSTAEMDLTDQEPIQFRYAPPITSAFSSFKFAANGSVKARVDFVVPQASVEASGDGFERWFTPSDGIGQLKTVKGSASTTYTVDIEGKNLDEFVVNYGTWAPGSYFEKQDNDGGFFLGRSDYSISPGTDGLVGNHGVTDGVATEIILPAGHWVADAGTADKEAFSLNGSKAVFTGTGTAFTFQSAGLTAVGTITIALLLSALVAGSFLLVRHRKALTARLREARNAIDAALPEKGLMNLTMSTDRGTSDGSLLNLQHHSAGPIGTGSTLAIAAANTNSWQDPGGSLLDLPSQARPHPTGTSLFDLRSGTSKPSPPSLFDQSSLQATK